MIKIHKYHSYYYLDFMYVVAAVRCSPWIARENASSHRSPGANNDTWAHRSERIVIPDLAV